MPDRFEDVSHAIRAAIAKGKTPGAVALVSASGHVVYARAFGHRMLKPQRRAMTLTTIFDLASLTKPVATATAYGVLIEKGLVKLSDRVCRFLPEFAGGPTLEHLLTHTSGLPAYENYLKRRLSPLNIIRAICGKPLAAAPGEKFLYSDLGFILLAEILRRVTGQPVDAFCRDNVFRPLGMKDTTFNPPRRLWTRCAATCERRGRMLCGQVHDENAFALGGVAGHAGLFSTAHDLARFCQMLLDEGACGSRQVLKPETVALLTQPRKLSDGNVRALGWDVDTGYSGPRGYFFPVGSFGHSGFTGTSLWLAPASETFVVLLTNRLHPDGKGDVLDLRREVATHAALACRGRTSAARVRRTLPGIEVLRAQGFKPLRGKRVGLITNHTGIDHAGASTIDLLWQSGCVKLAALFSPEHGIRGELDAPVASGVDAKTGLTIHSLYGERYRPTPKMLRGLDALVFDIQDVGVRFYTYTATMGMCMESAKDAGIEFVVLDRPNPLGGLRVEGPVCTLPRDRLTTYYSAPVRHGMTAGEMAQLANDRYGIGCRLTVIRAQGWRRAMWFDETGLPWVNPSPNLRNLKQAILYPCICCLESSNVSVGRGTDMPFEVFGAPWMDSLKVAAELNGLGLPGLSFTPIGFTPKSSKFQGERCGGVYVMLNDREAFQPVAAAARIIGALWRLHGPTFDLDATARMFGTAEAPKLIRRDPSGGEPLRQWEKDSRRFSRERRPFLLY